MNQLPGQPIEFDVNRIAVEFMQTNLERILGAASKAVRGVGNVIKLKLESTYPEYLRRTASRHARVKAFFAPGAQTPLYDFFVPLDLRVGKTTLRRAGAKELLEVAPHCVLIGSGGSGKTMEMRHLLLSAMGQRYKTPIFLELRNVGLKTDSLEKQMLEHLAKYKLTVDEDYLRKALGEGHFLLLLDGFDELDVKARKRVGQEILRLSELYPEAGIIVSSRQDPELESWSGFQTVHLEPLSLETAVQLVERVTYDDELKERFVTALRGGLFSRHKSFLSNPLLLSIMLLTYHETADIPGKISVFYGQAYDALFQRHDAYKGGYRRQRKTNLDVLDFARVFAAFSVRTLLNRQFTFTLSQALEHIEHAKKRVGLRFSPASFLADAKQAVCLLVDEGSVITFSHRSFQEYFAAKYAVTAPPSLKAQLIRRFGEMEGRDQVLSLLWELDQFSVEHHYILPGLEKLRGAAEVKSKVGRAQYHRFLAAVFGPLRFSVAGPRDDYGIHIKDGKAFHLLQFIYAHYPQVGKLGRLGGHRRPPLETLLADGKSEGETKSLDMAEVLRVPAMAEWFEASGGVFSRDAFAGAMKLESELRAKHSSPDLSIDSLMA